MQRRRSAVMIHAQTRGLYRGARDISVYQGLHRKILAVERGEVSANAGRTPSVVFRDAMSTVPGTEMQNTCGTAGTIPAMKQW